MPLSKSVNSIVYLSLTETNTFIQINQHTLCWSTHLKWSVVFFPPLLQMLCVKTLGKLHCCPSAGMGDNSVRSNMLFWRNSHFKRVQIHLKGIKKTYLSLLRYYSNAARPHSLLFSACFLFHCLFSPPVCLVVSQCERISPSVLSLNLSLCIILPLFSISLTSVSFLSIPPSDAKMKGESSF